MAEASGGKGPFQQTPTNSFKPGVGFNAPIPKGFSGRVYYVENIFITLESGKVINKTLTSNPVQIPTKK